MITKTTLELTPGDRVRLPGNVVRTVEAVDEWLDSFGDHVNGTYGDALYVVSYAERDDGTWGSGNCGTAKSEWRVLDSEGE